MGIIVEGRKKEEEETKGKYVHVIFKGMTRD